MASPRCPNVGHQLFKMDDEQTKGASILFCTYIETIDNLILDMNSSSSVWKFIVKLFSKC